MPYYLAVQFAGSNNFQRNPKKFETRDDAEREGLAIVSANQINPIMEARLRSAGVAVSPPQYRIIEE